MQTSDLSLEKLSAELQLKFTHFRSMEQVRLLCAQAGNFDYCGGFGIGTVEPPSPA